MQLVQHTPKQQLFPIIYTPILLIPIMKFVTAISALATLAAAAPSGSSSPLAVKLEMAENNVVKATVTNTGKDNLKIFKPNSIFDKSPVEKVSISKDGT